MEKKKISSIAKTTKRLIKQVDDLERMNKEGMNEKDLLKFQAEALGVSQKVMKMLLKKD